MARRGEGFGMRVLVRGRREGPPLEELLERADFVSLHVPLTAETRHLIGERQLQRMQPHAVLINTARGPVVDETALVRALREGWIAGAGLDVYEREPALAPGLAELENVVLAPHVGSATRGTRARMAEIAADNVIACLAGRPLPSPVVAGRR
jgi:glyoxylate reductase